MPGRSPGSRQTDARIAAVVAVVPHAAAFDLSTFATPRVPLGLISARKDVWPVPRFHGLAVVEACAGCEWQVDPRHISPPKPCLQVRERDGGEPRKCIRHVVLRSPLPRREIRVKLTAAVGAMRAAFQG
jgi:hypothetical protein